MFSSTGDRNYDPNLGSCGLVLPKSISDVSETESRTVAMESEIISLRIFNALYPITVPVILKVCSGISDVLRVKIFENRDNAPIVALVEFRSVFDACKVKDSINGADIYDNCCTLEVAFSSGRSPLFVEVNDDYNWDYRLRSRSKRSESSLDPVKRRTLLTLPQEPDQSGVDPPRRRREVSPDFNLNDRFNHPSKWQQCTGERRPDHRRGQRRVWGDFKERTRPPFYFVGPPMNRPPQRRGNVLMLYDLDIRLDPSKLFNLLCLYGDVARIKFLMTKEGCAMVEMADYFGVRRVLDYVSGCPVFGKRITIKHSWQESIFGEIDPNITLSNGSPAFQDFRKSRNQRFNNPSVARKNRIVAPCKVLHFFNVPSSVINSKEKMLEHLASHGVSEPVSVSFFPGSLEKVINSGLIEFATLSESVDALVACNNSNVQPAENVKHFSIKLCFSNVTGVPEENQKQSFVTRQETMQDARDVPSHKASF